MADAAKSPIIPKWRDQTADQTAKYIMSFLSSVSLNAKNTIASAINHIAW